MKEHYRKREHSLLQSAQGDVTVSEGGAYPQRERERGRERERERVREGERDRESERERPRDSKRG